MIACLTMAGTKIESVLLLVMVVHFVLLWVLETCSIQLSAKLIEIKVASFNYKAQHLDSLTAPGQELAEVFP